MSSRGAKIKNGHVTTKEFETLHLVGDAKVLIGTGTNHGLPDYAHTPGRVYIKENPDGTFRELRKYDEHGFPIPEIGYHPEPNLTGNKSQKILHFHTFDKNFNRFMGGKVSKTINSDIYKKYRMYLEAYGL